MKGIKITQISTEPFLNPAKFAIFGEIIVTVTTFVVGVIKHDVLIGGFATLFMLIVLGLTYLAYKVDHDVRVTDEYFISIGQMAEYDDIKQLFEEYKIINDLGDGRYLATKRSQIKTHRQKVKI